MGASFTFVVLCLLALRHLKVECEEFLPPPEEKLVVDVIKPNSRNIQQPDFGYNDVVNNDDDVTKEDAIRVDMLQTENSDVVPQQKQSVQNQDGGQLSNTGTPSNNGVQEGKSFDQSVNLIDILKSSPTRSEDMPAPVQTGRLQNTNLARYRPSSNNRFGGSVRRIDNSPLSVSRENTKVRLVNASPAAKSRCPECKEVLESIHKDMQGLNQEMDTIAHLISAVLTQRNCSIHELLPEHRWKLDGKCKDDIDTDNRVCAMSCSSLFLHPETKKTPIGRAMTQLRLEPAPHHGVCASLIDGASGSFVDLGDWAGSCISQPERCSSGLSITAWLKLDINRESNIAYILTSGDYDTRSRGFVVLARHQEDLGRTNIGLTIWLRDATYFWSAVATAPTKRWCYFGFSWSRSGDLDVFIDGQRVTRNAIVTQDCSIPSPMTRLTIGNPPSVEKFIGSFAIADLRLYLVRLEERDMLELFRSNSNV